MYSLSYLVNRILEDLNFSVHTRTWIKQQTEMQPLLNCFMAYDVFFFVMAAIFVWQNKKILLLYLL